MQYIKLFVATSIRNFEEGFNELGDYIRTLNDLYVRRDVYFKLVLCDDISTDVLAEHEREEKEKSIADSHFFYVLFGDEADRKAIADCETALRAFHEKNLPRVFIYFRQQPEEQQKDSVKAFMQRVDREIKHYFSTYQTLDTVKLNFLLELARIPEMMTTLTFENGQARLNGQDILPLEHIPAWSRNEVLQRYIRQLEELNKQFAELSAAHTALPDNGAIMQSMLKTDEERAKLNQQISSLEKNLLECFQTINAGMTSGSLNTERLKKAASLLEQGDYAGANAVLNDPQREVELERAKQKMKLASELIGQANNAISSYIREDRLHIKALEAQGITMETIPHIIACYKRSAALANEYDIEIEIIEDYARFLFDQNDYPAAYMWVERFLRLTEKKQNNEAELARGYNLLAAIHYRQNHYDDAEALYRRALEIYEALAEKNPDAYLPDVADSYNSLAILLRATNRYEDAEKLYRRALEIREALAEKNPDAYLPNVAISCNNLANLLSDTNHYEDAEKLYRRALEIREALAERNPDVYLSSVANSCINLAKLYKDTERCEESKRHYQRALQIVIALAKKTPDKYSSNNGNSK